MPLLNVSLTPELLQLIQTKVESGLYDSASDVVRDAIRQMESNADLLAQLKFARLKDALADGVRQAERADAESYSLKELLADLDNRS